MDGSIFRVHLCPVCHLVTWQADVCLSCQRSTTTAAAAIDRKDS